MFSTCPISFIDLPSAMSWSTVDLVGQNTVARHIGEQRGFGRLDNRDAAFSLDRLEAEHAVGVRAGENDAERFCLLIGAERDQKSVDGMGDDVGRAVLDAKDAAFQPRVHAGREDVDLVRIRPGPIGDLRDAHWGRPSEDFRHVALLVGREVRDDDERHPGIAGKRAEKVEIRFEAAGRGADSDHRKRQRALVLTSRGRDGVLRAGRDRAGLSVA
jgi:hypothetical protein